MTPELSLEEHVPHGTKQKPLTVIAFRTGAGTLYPDHFFVERHWHYNMELVLIKKGHYKAEINLETLALSEGDLCMINSGELHMLEGEEKDTLHDVLIFNPQILDFSYEDELQSTCIAPLLQRKKVLPRIMRPGEPCYDTIIPLFRKLILLGMEQNTGWYMELKLNLLRLIYLLSENELLDPVGSVTTPSEKERIDRYKRVVSRIESDFSEPLSLEMLAQAAGCNPQYLCRFFKDIAGISPIQYLIRYRLQKAESLLENTTKSVLDISLECGFENVSYFIRQFKKYAGHTPREYRSASSQRKK